MDTMVYVSGNDVGYQIHKKVDGGWLVWGDYTDPESYWLCNTLDYQMACTDYTTGVRKEPVYNDTFELFIPDVDVVRVTQEPLRYTLREWAAIWPRNHELETQICQLAEQYHTSQLVKHQKT